MSQKHEINILNVLIISIILFMPFQQAFTLQVGATIRIADLLIAILFFILFFLQFNKKEKIVNINIFYLYMLINTIIISLYLNNFINEGLATLSSAKSRTIVNIFTALVAIFAYSIGTYIGKVNVIFSKVIKLWTKIIIFISIYAIIQFIVLNTLGTWFHIPGEFLNEETSYAYGIRRAYGFSIEPGAFGSLLLFSFILIFNFLESCKLKNISLFFCLIAIFCSMSSVALITLIVFILLLIYKKGLKFKYKVMLTFALIILIFIVFNNSSLYSAIIDKLAGGSYSKVDRLTNSSILTKMFLDYPIFGVGFGNYGALRNLYATNTLIQYKAFYDMPNSFYFAIIGELGIVGVGLFIKFIKDKIIQLKKMNKSVILFIIPFLILISPSSSITSNYIALGLGIIYGRYLYVFSKKNNKLI